MDPRLCRRLRRQPLHGGRGLRSAGGVGLSAITPRRRLHTSAGPAATRTAPSDDNKRNEQLVWLIRQLLSAGDDTVLARGPWLPNAWLGAARLNVVRAFKRIGLESFVEPADGIFLWARFPHIDDSLALAETARHRGQMLAPGTVFRPHLARSPWMRFNVAVCEDARVQDQLARLASSIAT